MKIYTTTLLVILSQIGLLKGQSVEISPINPSPNDCIYIYTRATTSSLAYPSGLEIGEAGNNITIEACYTQTAATAIGVYYDTINLGYKEEGIYNLNYIVARARNGIPCKDADTTSAQLTFEVKENALSKLPCRKLKATIFPNPLGHDEFLWITASETITQIDIFDSLGRFIIRKASGGNEHFNFSSTLFPGAGVYFVRINGASLNTVTLKVVKL